MGDYERALAHCEQSLTIREEALAKNHPYVADSLSNLAELHRTNGDYERALRLHERSLAIRKEVLGNDHPYVADSLTNLAMLYSVKGDSDRALSLYQQSLAILEQALGKHHAYLGDTLNNLAELYRSKGDHDRAISLHERALAIYEKSLGKNHPYVAASLNNLALVYQAKGDHERALPLHERALAIREKAQGKHHPYVATSLNNLAEVYKARGEHEKALRLHERSLATFEKALGKNHPRVADSLTNLALLHWVRGSQTRVATYLQPAMEAREAHFGLVGAADSARARRLLLAQYAGDLDRVIGFVLQYPQPSVRRLAMATVLSRKGRVLDSVTDAFAAVRQRLGPDERNLLDEYRRNRMIYASQFLRGPGSISRQQHHKNLAALEKRGHELEGLIAGRSKELRGLLRPVTLTDVQDALPAGTALVEWVRYRAFDPGAVDDEAFGAERYAAGILHETGDPVWLDLGEAAAIDAAVEAWRTALLTRAAHEYTGKAATRLDELIMAPVRAQLGDVTRVYLAPDGVLHQVPFAALVDERGRYLVERYLFTYLTSGRDLVRLQSHADAAPRSPALIVAAPRFTLAGQIDRPPFPPLPEVLVEARAVHQHFDSARLVTGSEANEAVLQGVQGPAILHIATHGYFEPTTCGEVDELATEPLLQSGLALAGANECRGPGSTAGEPSESDGLLTALELTGLDLHGTELAVLSACDTGVGREVGRSDGLYGLRRALVLAGAKTQMISLWKVDDNASRRIMPAYYQKLAEGQGRSQALRAVQLELLRNPDRLTGHPHYWASFIVSGSDAPLLATGLMRPDPPRGSRGCACDTIAASSQKPALSTTVAGRLCRPDPAAAPTALYTIQTTGPAGGPGLLSGRRA